jgi:hypothetical protein
VQLPLAAPARVVIEADGCAEPEDEEEHDPHCYSFAVNGLRLTRIELYDVAHDPGQRRDVSRERRRSTRALLAELLAFRPRALATAVPMPLEPELEKSLRDLGYLK